MQDVYAEALYKVTEVGKSPRAAVTALHKVLEREGRAALLPQIRRAFVRIAERERRRDTMTLSISDRAPKRSRAEAKKALSAMRMKFRNVEMQKDTDLIGGWRLEGREHMYDASFKRHLLELYKRVTST